MIDVLYISYDGMTDPLGQSQVLPYLLKLTELGYKFTLLSCEKPKRYKAGRSKIESILKNTPIDWHPIFYTKRPPILSTIYDYLKLKRAAFDLNKVYQYKIVHCRSYISSMIGLSLKRKFGTKFIFDMRGFWADERVDGGLWNLRNPLYGTIYRFFKNREKDFLNNADYIVSLTTKGKAEILSWQDIQIEPDLIKVIPCCADTQLFDPSLISKAEKATIRNNLNINEADFILTYLGSIGTWYLLDEMLDFFIELKKDKPGAKFLFITMDEHDLIRNLSALKDISPDDILIKPAQRYQVPALLSISNWSVFFIKPSYSKMSSSPTKQGELMAMGIPVICNAGVGDTDDIIEKYTSGVRVNSFNYTEAIKEINRFNTDSLTIRNGAIDYFSLNNGIEKYANIYKCMDR